MQLCNCISLHTYLINDNFNELSRSFYEAFWLKCCTKNGPSICLPNARVVSVTEKNTFLLLLKHIKISSVLNMSADCLQTSFRVLFLMNLKSDPYFWGKKIYIEAYWRREFCEECLDTRRNKLVGHSGYLTKRGISAIRSERQGMLNI